MDTQHERTAAQRLHQPADGEKAEGEMKAIVYDAYGSPDVLRLEDVPRPKPGDEDVLIRIRAASVNSWDWDNLTGAGGGVGSFAVQLAKAYGAEVTGIDRGDKLDFTRSLGADHVIDYTVRD